jgi:hypothetical protein
MAWTVRNKSLTIIVKDVSLEKRGVFMTRKQVQKIMDAASFVCHDGIITDFIKEYKCGAKVSYFFDSKDKQIMLHWHTDYTSNFTYPKDFPAVNKYHYGKATTFHRFEDLASELSRLEKTYGIE